MTATIEELAEKDLEEAAEVSRECLHDAWERWEKDYYPREALEYDLTQHSAEEYEKFLKLPRSFFFVAKEKGRIVGLALGRIIGKTGLANLGWICVAPKSRRRGIGDSILERLEEYARSEGCHKIFLNTLPCLTDAVRLYFKRGWIPECNLKRHWWKVDFIVMSKWFD
ncbi:MAG: GNAT family N-acetyltransferase [Thermoplasmata archaeon]